MDANLDSHMDVCLESNLADRKAKKENTYTEIQTVNGEE